MQESSVHLPDLGKVAQGLFHVQLGSNLNTKQSLYVYPFWL